MHHYLKIFLLSLLVFFTGTSVAEAKKKRGHRVSNKSASNQTATLPLAPAIAAPPAKPPENAYLKALFKDLTGPNHEFTVYELKAAAIAKKYPELYNQFIKLRATIQATLPDHQGALSLTNQLLTLEPEWLDGYWFAAGYEISFAEWNMRHQQKEEALTLFQKAEAHMQTCLKMDSQHPVCQFLLAAAMARLAAIKGLATSLQKGKGIYTTLQKVVASKVNMRFQDHNPRSLQGATHHGLGIFYRVVPHSWLLNLFLGFSGDLDQSEAFHRRSIEIDGPVSAYVTELAVTLLCQHEKKANPSKYQEAERLLAEVSVIESPLPMDQFYIANAKKLRENLSGGCHFMFGKTVKPLSDEAIKSHLGK